MVKSLYKFMPFRETFFENFLLRASHINTLISVYRHFHIRHFLCMLFVDF
jgi:hypothetical protein